MVMLVTGGSETWIVNEMKKFKKKKIDDYYGPGTRGGGKYTWSYLVMRCNNPAAIDADMTGVDTVNWQDVLALDIYREVVWRVFTNI